MYFKNSYTSSDTICICRFLYIVVFYFFIPPSPLMKYIIFIFLSCIFFLSTASTGINHLSITISSKTYSGGEIYEHIDRKIESYTYWDIEKKAHLYTKLSKNLDQYANTANANTLKQIILYGDKKAQQELKKYYATTRKIILWYTQNNLPIEAYVRGDPKEWYFWIFAGMHWWYEYGTYLSALALKKKLEQSNKTGWFIIPSINPEGLEIYWENGSQEDAYITGRSNSNNIDLNRNFCGSDFVLNSFIKNGIQLDTGRWWCGSEAETQVISNTLSQYSFKQIISLHSAGNIIFIPDYSFDDTQLIHFAKQVSRLMTDYDFDISYSSQQEKDLKIQKYEINERWQADFTGTMENYIYEKYKIPTLLIELPEHGTIDNSLLHLVTLFDEKN